MGLEYFNGDGSEYVTPVCVDAGQPGV